MRVPDRESWQPVPVPATRLTSFLRSHRGTMVVDEVARNLGELFLLRNPRYRFNRAYAAPLAAFQRAHQEQGNWFYFSWFNTVVRYLPHAMHQELRTGRNRYLITEREQERYYGATIGVLGMSVGSHVATTIAMTGGARRIKLADPDTISGDNLNRIRTGFHNVGLNKAVAVAREIAAMNPYAKIEAFKEGLTERNMARFLRGLDVLVEEMDNPYLKVRVRFEARARRIPVIMAADNGDGIIADVERFDLNRTYPIMHGVLGKMRPEDLKSISPRDLPGVMAKIAGADIAAIRMLESVREVGKSIYSWPQLGTAATMCGAVLAYLARRVALRDPKIKSGRYEVNPDAIFEAGFASPRASRARSRKRRIILHTLRR